MDDKGKESPQVMLARIDERTAWMKEEQKNTNHKLTLHMVSFEEHKIDDNKNFSKSFWWIAIGVGIIGTLQFVILATKH